MFLLISVHVMANLVWIGAITCTGWLLATGAKEGDSALAKASADLAFRIYRRLATPAFGVSFLFGIAALGANAAYYMHAHWFHGKLTFALVVIALHHVIGAKARRAASGGVQGGGSSAILTAGLLASVFAVVLLVIFKTSLVP